MFEVIMVLALLISGAFYLTAGLLPGMTDDPVEFIAVGVILLITGLAMLYFHRRESRKNRERERIAKATVPRYPTRRDISG